MIFTKTFLNDQPDYRDSPLERLQKWEQDPERFESEIISIETLNNGSLKVWCRNQEKLPDYGTDILGY